MADQIQNPPDLQLGMDVETSSENADEFMIPGFKFRDPVLRTPGTPRDRPIPPPKPSTFTRQDIDDIAHIVNAIVRPMKDELNQVKKELESERKDKLVLKERLFKLEGFSRRYNLKFQGIQEWANESKLDCKRQILDVLQHVGLKNKTLWV